MTEARFEVHREGGPPPWWAVFTCPHGGRAEILVSPNAEDLGKKGVWRFEDLGNGRCRISPSILWSGGSGVHAQSECHFGPGDFAFEWADPVDDGRRVSEPERFRP